ncbi:hypothetical protein M409DRAFT_30880 [Zasmidium cellare ATCC 36951]|uniref:ZZ-type domain-containing protein n=1 Tax=Zasmidium cellare ATCC 36951 TaxID=1080233 RepID=A0A6A6BXD6_ZASCE|nr:uncharacterized protein M409DRAFT_30880 [Zasmidium cellare ATCC 36951]KAF2158600.1 hypothetical protein M409DRAFT_30880 [Zasmidium cellare ATCC 36951]
MAACITGYNNTMDVAGFGFNTQSAMFYQSLHAQHDVHNGVICDSCGANPLRGIRWRCQTCPDHDICGECKNRGAGVGHRFDMMSVGQTNDVMNGVGQRFQASQEAGVHWTSCKGCQMYPIRGTLYACTICPGFDMCENCNRTRLATQTHQHRFDFFYCARACNPPPSSQGQYTPSTYANTHYQGGSAEQQLAQNQAAYEAEQKEILHQGLVSQEQQQGHYDNSLAAQQYGAMYGDRKRDRVAALMGLR